MEMKLPGRKPQGRQKKTWIKNVEEDLTGWNLDEEDMFDQEMESSHKMIIVQYHDIGIPIK